MAAHYILTTLGGGTMEFDDPWNASAAWLASAAHDWVSCSRKGVHQGWLDPSAVAGLTSCNLGFQLLAGAATEGLTDFYPSIRANMPPTELEQLYAAAHHKRLQLSAPLPRVGGIRDARVELDKRAESMLGADFEVGRGYQAELSVIVGTVDE